MIQISKLQKRLIEMLPGLLTWAFILLFVVLSLFSPAIVAFIVVFYCVYFVYESVTLVILMLLSAKTLKQTMKTNWIVELDTLQKEKGVDWKEIYQVTMIPYANESMAVLRPTIQCLVDSNYPKERKILVLAPEARLTDGCTLAEELKKEFQDAFFDILITKHSIVAGEIIGKASNENYAARELYKYIVEKGIDPKHVIVTSNDSDGRQHIEYMARLTYVFLSETEPQKRIYQPILVFFNNIWVVPIISRIIATFSVQWQLGIARKPHRFQNFAIYALSLDTLHKAGYWDPDIIPEDERIYWKVVNYYGNGVKVVPLYIPIYQDAVKASSYLKSLKEQYLQIRRWAWGASEIVYSLPNLYKNEKIPLGMKFIYIFQQLRKSFEWAMAPFILFFGLSLPSFINPTFSHNILANSLPFILSRILTFTTILLVAVFYIEESFAPKKPSQWSIFRVGFSFLQWIAFPFVSIVFSALPALEAQTRLIVGKPIAYKVTEKAQ